MYAPTDAGLNTLSTKLGESRFELLIASPQMTRLELAKKLDVGEDAIRLYLANLKRSGRLERVGGRKEGFWQVID